MIEIMIRVFCRFSKTEYTLGYSIVKSFLEALGSQIQRMNKYLSLYGRSTASNPASGWAFTGTQVYESLYYLPSCDLNSRKNEYRMSLK